MKYGFALGLSFAILVLVNMQEISSSKQADLPLIGLRVGTKSTGLCIARSIWS